MSTETVVRNLTKQLRNVGPKLAAKLIEARIDSLNKLRQLGVKKAFEKMYAAGDYYGDCNAAYLYTLEVAIRDCDWLDVHPVAVYGWAGDTDDPISIELKHTGDHTIRIQPRQIPHRIDQIWLSRTQHRIPNTLGPIKQ